MVVADGNTIQNCSSFGNPEPHMWLSFKNRNISVGERYVTLKIQTATSNNSGEYICNARNKVGHSRVAFFVEIKGKIWNFENRQRFSICKWQIVLINFTFHHIITQKWSCYAYEFKCNSINQTFIFLFRKQLSHTYLCHLWHFIPCCTDSDYFNLSVHVEKEKIKWTL